MKFCSYSWSWNLERKGILESSRDVDLLIIISATKLYTRINLGFPFYGVNLYTISMIPISRDSCSVRSQVLVVFLSLFSCLFFSSMHLSYFWGSCRNVNHIWPWSCFMKWKVKSVSQISAHIRRWWMHLPAKDFAKKRKKYLRSCKKQGTNLMCMLIMHLWKLTGKYQHYIQSSMS